MEKYRRNPYSLLSWKNMERMPFAKQLAQEFQMRIPPRFANIRILVPPFEERGMEMALRADCTNPGCGVRVVNHVIKTKSGEWKFVEPKPVFDRTGNNPCRECQNDLDL